jgi:hypothetical protein
VDQQHQVLADAKVEGGQPDDGFEPARLLFAFVVDEGVDLAGGELADAAFAVGVEEVSQVRQCTVGGGLVDSEGQDRQDLVALGQGNFPRAFD